MQDTQRFGAVRDSLAADPAPGEEAQQRVAERDLVVHHEDREVAAGGGGARRDRRFGPGFLARVARQRNGEARSLPGLRLHPDAAAVFAGDPVADGEPEARPDALGLGREERVEDLAADLGRDPRAGVGDLESGLAFVGARTNDDGAWSIDRHECLLGVDQQIENHLLELGGVRPDLRLARVEVERDGDVQRREVIRPQGERAPRDVVHVHEGALLAAGAGEREQIRGDASDARRFVVHHLEHLAVLGLQLVQQQRLREAGDDRGRIVDLVGHAAHELPHRGELLRLLELGLTAFLLGDVARQDQHSGDAAAFADRGVERGRDAVGSVIAREGNLEALDLAVERRRQLLPHHGRRVGGQEFEDVTVFHRPGERAHDPGGSVRFEDASLPVDHHDRIGHGVHDEAQIALRGGGGGERVHQRPGLAGDLVLEQRGVAPVGAGGVDQSQPDDPDGQRDEHGTPHVGLGGQRVSDRDRADAGQPDHERRDAGRVAREGTGAGLRGGRGRRRHGGGGGEQQQACVPAEIEHAARAERPPQCGRGVQDVRDAEDPQRGHHARRGQGDAGVAQQLHQDQPQHADAAHGPPEAREQRWDVAGQVEQRFEEELVGERTRRERDEHGVDEQLVVESAARRGPDQLGHGHEEADVDAQKAYVRERGVGRRHAADQLVVAPDELAGQEQDAAGADPHPGAPLIG